MPLRKQRKSCSSSDSEIDVWDPIIQSDDSTYYSCLLCKCDFDDAEEHVYLESHYLLCAKDIYGDDLDECFGKEEPKKIERKSNKKNKANTEKKSKEIPESELTITEGILHFPLINENRITYRIRKKVVYSCKACKCAIHGLDKIYEHIIQSQHKENLEKMNRKPIQKFTSASIDKNTFFYCNKCEILMEPEETLIQCHCLMHLNKEKPNLKNDIVQFTDFKNGKMKMECLICNMMTDHNPSLAEHLQSPKHVQRLDYFLFMSTLKKELEGEKECQIEGDLSFNAHNDLHLKKYCSCLQIVDFNLNKSLKDISQINPQCQDHCMKKAGEEIEFYKCFLCSKSMRTQEALILHYKKGAGHRRRIMYFSKIGTDLDFIRKLDYKPIAGIIEQVPKTQKQRRIREEVKFPFNDDLSKFGSSYINSCLKPGKQNIYKRDPEEIRLMELGIALMYPYKGYKICIPCGCQIKPDNKSIYEHIKFDEHIENICTMETFAKQFENCEDEFSDMDLAKSCMMEESEKFVRCFACDLQITNSNEDIKIHINERTHIAKNKTWKENSKSVIKNFVNLFNDLWYYADRFHCDVCKLPLKREICFARHLEHPEHIGLVKKYNKDFKVNICFSCSCCWYGLPDYKKHFDSMGHERASRGNNTIHPVMKSTTRKLIHNIEKCIEMLVRESNALKFNEDDHVVQSVLATVQPLYPNAKAYTFGSRTSYLGFNSSDVDVFLDCENIYHELGSKEKSQEYIKKVKKHFSEKNRTVWKMDSVLLQPRVPIIKLVHRPTGLKCDISFMNGLGVEKSKLIRSYVITHPIVRSLMLFFKKWLDVNNLYGCNSINGYAVSWFTIFFLQTMGIVPSVSQLIKIKNQSNLVDGWECGFSNQVNVRMYSNYSVRQLMQQFFKYYANFNYRTDVVCPFLGRVLKKQDFVDAESLPEDMNIYKLRLKQQEMELFRYDSPMVIQDPVDLSQNITKAVTKIKLRCFRSYCFMSLRLF